MKFFYNFFKSVKFFYLKLKLYQAAVVAASVVAVAAESVGLSVQTFAAESLDESSPRTESEMKGKTNGNLKGDIVPWG